MAGRKGKAKQLWARLEKGEVYATLQA